MSDDGEARARCSSSARRGASRCHAVSGSVERDVQRLPGARDRRSAGRRRRVDQRRLRRARTRTRTSASSRSPATRPTATRSAPRRCATSRSSRRSCTTARSRAWRPRSATTSTCSPRARAYDAATAGLAPDLTGPTGRRSISSASIPSSPSRAALSSTQFEDLLAFVRDGLLDPRATPGHLERLVPASVPSGRPTMTFEFPRHGCVKGRNPAHEQREEARC